MIMYYEPFHYLRGAEHSFMSLVRASLLPPELDVDYPGLILLISHSVLCSNGSIA
jgi:hypothetical protein